MPDTQLTETLDLADLIRRPWAVPGVLELVSEHRMCSPPPTLSC